MILRLLIHHNAKLTPDIIFKIVFVTIQVIFRDVGQYGDIRSECFDIIQLKTADLCYIQGFRTLCYLPGERITYVANQYENRTIKRSIY